MGFCLFRALLPAFLPGSDCAGRWEKSGKKGDFGFGSQ
jgi:hypothetical protein